MAVRDEYTYALGMTGRSILLGGSPVPIRRDESGRLWYRRRQFPSLLCLIPAIIPFGPALGLTVYVMSCFLISSRRGGTAQGVVVLTLTAAFTVPLAYLVAKTIYLKLRFEWVRWSGKRCLSCGYNLTGNVSGICPECGWELPPLMEAESALTRAPHS